MKITFPHPKFDIGDSVFFCDFDKQIVMKKIEAAMFVKNHSTKKLEWQYRMTPSEANCRNVLWEKDLYKAGRRNATYSFDTTKYQFDVEWH